MCFCRGSAQQVDQTNTIATHISLVQWIQRISVVFSMTVVTSFRGCISANMSFCDWLPQFVHSPIRSLLLHAQISAGRCELLTSDNILWFFSLFFMFSSTLSPYLYKSEVCVGGRICVCGMLFLESLQSWEILILIFYLLWLDVDQPTQWKSVVTLGKEAWPLKSSEGLLGVLDIGVDNSLLHQCS